MYGNYHIAGCYQDLFFFDRIDILRLQGLMNEKTTEENWAYHSS